MLAGTGEGRASVRIRGGGGGELGCSSQHDAKLSRPYQHHLLLIALQYTKTLLLRLSRRKRRVIAGVRMIYL